VAALALMMIPVVALAAAGFIDVPADSPHIDGIQYVSDTGISVGYGDGTFGPLDFVTRAQMATFDHNDSATSFGTAGVYLDSDDDNDVIVDVYDVTVPGATDHAFFIQVFGE